MGPKKRRQENKETNVPDKNETTGDEKRMQEAGAAEKGENIPEIKEIKMGTDAKEMQSASGKGYEKKRRSVWGPVFGVLLTAAVAVLAICLYKTSAQLQSVQAFSSGLQTKLKATETKVNELSATIREGGAGNHATEELPEETQDEFLSVTKMPYPTPVPEVYTVCIDAGHGAHDTGAVLEYEDGTTRQEKDDNLWLSQLVQKELESYGVKVVMTRDDDSFLELYDRTLLANSLDVDALISFHRNAFYLNGKMNDRVSGVEIWIHSSLPTSSRQLANRMLDAILSVGGMADRGVKYGSMTDFDEDYAINRRAMMPSMIVEMGFISNDEDNAAYDANGEAYAKAMAKVIYEWLTEQK